MSPFADAITTAFAMLSVHSWTWCVREFGKLRYPICRKGDQCAPTNVISSSKNQNVTCRVDTIKPERFKLVGTSRIVLPCTQIRLRKGIGIRTGLNDGEVWTLRFAKDAHCMKNSRCSQQWRLSYEWNSGDDAKKCWAIVKNRSTDWPFF